jgi:hypothetical protein
MFKWIASKIAEHLNGNLVRGNRATPVQLFENASETPARITIYVEDVNGGHIVTFKTALPTNSPHLQQKHQTNPYMNDDGYTPTKYIVPSNEDLGEKLLAGLALEKMKLLD